jgi:hypothetical protein
MAITIGGHVDRAVPEAALQPKRPVKHRKTSEDAPAVLPGPRPLRGDRVWVERLAGSQPVDLYA